MGKKPLFIFFAVMCLLVSFVLRSRSYWLFPPAQDGFDEFAAAWQGLSLLKTGIPTSWSFHPYYDREVAKGRKLDLIGMSITVDDQTPSVGNFKSFPKPLLLKRELEIDGFRTHFNIVQPDLEQPPLGGVLIALAPLLKGRSELAQVTLRDIRLPFIFLGVVNTLLVVLLAKRWYGSWAGLLSGFVYATVPTIVISSRLAVPENILAFLLLLFVYLLELKRTKLLYLISFIAPLIRPFGLAIPLAGAAYAFWVEKDKKKVIIYLLLGAVSFLSYFIYGLVYDQKIFMDALAFQSQRFFAGPQVFLYKFMIPRITKIFLDGWIVFGWLAVFFMSIINKNKKHLLLLIGLFSYVLVLTFFGGEDYGWYRTPFYTFLSMGIGYLLVRAIKKGSFFLSLLFILIPLATSLYWSSGWEDWTKQLLFFRIFLGVSVLLLISKKTAKVFMLVIIVLALCLNVLTMKKMSSIWPRLGESSSLILYRK